MLTSNILECSFLLLTSVLLCAKGELRGRMRFGSRQDCPIEEASTYAIELDDLLGLWYEIGRTHFPFEHMLSCNLFQFAVANETESGW